jgi:hypothetical protein
MNCKFLAISFASMLVLACAMAGPASARGGGGGGGHGSSYGGGSMKGGSMKGGSMMGAIGPTGSSWGSNSVACKTGKEHSSRCRRGY